MQRKASLVLLLTSPEYDWRVNGLHENINLRKQTLSLNRQLIPCPFVATLPGRACVGGIVWDIMANSTAHRCPPAWPGHKILPSPIPYIIVVSLLRSS